MMIKSNPTPARWVTHKLENNYMTDSLTGAKILNPKSGFPAWRSGIEKRSLGS